jgi:hypothetical protein
MKPAMAKRELTHHDSEGRETAIYRPAILARSDRSAASFAIRSFISRINLSRLSESHSAIAASHNRMTWSFNWMICLFAPSFMISAPQREIRLGK